MKTAFPAFGGKETIMLHERIEAARPIAQKIADAEQSFNKSLQLIGELLTEIPRARQQFAGRVPLETGMAASERLAAAAVSATNAYKEVVKAHSHLAADRNSLGMRTVSLGDISGCPDVTGKQSNEEPHLSVVKAA
jgi:hypothetical protein